MTEKKEEKGEKPAVGRQRAVILNFWWSLNYGAILTAYALQRELEKLGVDNRLVNFLHEWCREPFKNSFSEKFAERYLKVMPPFESVADLVELNRTADVFIVGSDQVFRLSYNAGYEFYYYLPFVDADKKKIACAASFGASELEGTIADRELVRCYLSGFDAVSVRETDGLRLCGEELRRSDAALILDPVFWPAPGEWETLIRNAYDGEKDFGLTYVLDQNKETDAVAAAAEHRFAVGKVIDMGNAQKDREITLSPEQWLYNIKNCRYMVTDSFHGACFAIIFNKPFICVANRERGISRFESLFDMLGLSSRLVKNGETLDGRADLFETIDYAAVNQKLAAEVARSRRWMAEALQKPKAPQSFESEMTAFMMQRLSLAGCRIRSLEERTEEMGRMMIKAGLLRPYRVRYWRNRLLAALTFGKMRKKYKAKSKECRQKIDCLKKVLKGGK